MRSIIRDQRGMVIGEWIFIIGVFAFITAAGVYDLNVREEIAICQANQVDIMIAINMWEKEHPGEKWEKKKGEELYEALAEYLPPEVFECPRGKHNGPHDYATKARGKVVCLVDPLVHSRKPVIAKTYFM